MRAPFAPPRLSEPRKDDAAAQAVETSCEIDRPDARIFCLQCGDVRFADELVVDGGNGVLPDQLLLGNQGAEVADDGAHIAMGELEPGASEGVGELGGVGLEALADRFVGGIELECEVRGEHHGQMLLVLDVRVRDVGFLVHGVPLPATAGAFLQRPVVVVEVVEVLAVPLDGVAGPRAFEAGGDGVFGVALAGAVLPAEALLLDGCAFGFGADVWTRVVRAMAFAEGVAAGDEREGLFVVHGHAAEGLADIARGGDWVGLAIGAFRVHVDEAHLHGGERMVKIALTLVTIAAKPRVFRAPEDVFLRNPDVSAAAAEAEGLETHRVERDVAGKDHEIGPGDLLAVLLLDGP